MGSRLEQRRCTGSFRLLSGRFSSPSVPWSLPSRFLFGCAIYISELASPRVKTILKPAIELLAGIPPWSTGSSVLSFSRMSYELYSISRRETRGLPHPSFWGSWLSPRSSVSPRMQSVGTARIPRRVACHRCNPVADDQPGNQSRQPSRASLLPSFLVSAGQSGRPWRS